MTHQPIAPFNETPEAAFFQSFSEAALERIADDTMSNRERLIASPLVAPAASAAEAGGATARIVDLIHSLSSRLFGGDIRAFGRACGISDDDVLAITSLDSTSPDRFAWSDAYLTREGWKFPGIASGYEGLNDRSHRSVRRVNYHYVEGDKVAPTRYSADSLLTCSLVSLDPHVLDADVRAIQQAARVVLI